MVTPNKIRRRPRTVNANERHSFVYTITVGEKSFKVCKAAFVSLHGVKESRLKRKVLKMESSIDDGRGKHSNHHKMEEAIKQRVKHHIESFPARESHYSRTKNLHKNYLDSSLSIAEMHQARRSRGGLGGL